MFQFGLFLGGLWMIFSSPYWILGIVLILSSFELADKVNTIKKLEEEVEVLKALLK